MAAAGDGQFSAARIPLITKRVLAIKKGMDTVFCSN
jgi:hypothetical protein